MHQVIDKIEIYLRDLQARISTVLEKEEGRALFQEDPWQHPGGGGGFTRTLAEGAVIEKAGVNFSRVRGQQLPQAATEKRPELGGGGMQFEALGVSVVVHPRNPYAPTTHANIRFIYVEKEQQAPQWWFGGGFDLTPYYGYVEDCEHWHRSAKEACQPFGEPVYPRYKAWCDEYFYLKHRQEPRGIGGIFFDDLNDKQEWGWDFERCFAFMQSVGDSFIGAYQPILNRRKDQAYGERERQFQCYRRGRYVEFNLLYDRGTLFGLQSGGRTESILMSLPPEVSWRYDWQPELGTREEELYSMYLKPQNW